jgi:hypothetical protein
MENRAGIVMCKTKMPPRYRAGDITPRIDAETVLLFMRRRLADPMPVHATELSWVAVRVWSFCKLRRMERICVNKTKMAQ